MKLLRDNVSATKVVIILVDMIFWEQRSFLLFTEAIPSLPGILVCNDLTSTMTSNELTEQENCELRL